MMNKVTTSQYSEKAIKAYHETGLPPNTFRCQASDNGYEITMYDVIGSDACNENTFAAALQDAAGAPVTIRLSSPGGSVFDGWAMYNNLKNYDGDSTVIVDGVCASIATVVALGADTVQTQAQSLWMIHNSWTVTVGDSAGLRKTADTLDKVNANLAEVYANKSGTEASLWAEMMQNETWYTSSEAVAAGLVDSVYEAPPKKRGRPKSQAKTINETRAANGIGPIQAAAAFDPDQDGDDDGAECVGLLNSAILLLQEAVETMTATPGAADDDGAMDSIEKLKSERELRIRRAMIAAMGLEIEKDQMARAMLD